ncbi:cob(I)yrinic acid a,c-diamide adenosyltransferase [Dysgonomonas capnocytophagoides]|uniref:cob(I)yrinic acid a,c-diamide adenosyltransferase n=1 Tax=Dysgonomonas capnocytophagoides TaxID=45254 RepID=UPI0029256176|nr:cob(I)yrinic acid a,c-diamide adenosyltransferase [Dysgonomonas capnocytophagoides]
MNIYTRGGDKGKTGIHGGQRVDKDDIRIEANGCIDELNSMIGVIRAFLPAEHEWQQILFRIQSELMVVMSHVATPSAIREKNPNPLPDNLDKFCEECIDNMTDNMGQSLSFILPGGNLVSSHLQLARTIARRSERRLWTLNKQDEVPESILKFINRLSDLFFTMARFEMFRDGTGEERWKDFLYKRKKKDTTADE